MDRKRRWILIEKDAHQNPALCQIADHLNITMDVCFSRWFRLWNWIDDHFPDGKLAGVSFRALDAVSGIEGFAESFSEVGWIRKIEGGLEVPGYSERWGRIAKQRWLTALRTRTWRERQRQTRSIDAASVEKLSIDGEQNVTQAPPERHPGDADVTLTSRSRDAHVTFRAQDLLRSSPSSALTQNSSRSIESIRFEPIERNEFSWEKMRVDANKIANWVEVKDRKRREDRKLIVTACILAQARLNEAWLWAALEAVKQHGPANSAAYFRRCLTMGLEQFTGRRELVDLLAIYRDLESLVTIPESYLEGRSGKEKAS